MPASRPNHSNSEVMPDSTTPYPDELAKFLEHHPDVEMIDVFFADLSGVIRGKRLPVDLAAKFFTTGGALYPARSSYCIPPATAPIRRAWAFRMVIPTK